MLEIPHNTPQTNIHKQTLLLFYSLKYLINITIFNFMLKNIILFVLCITIYIIFVLIN